MNKVTKHGWLGLLALALGFSSLSIVKAQDPVWNPVWSIYAPTSNWFLIDDNTSGMALNPATGHLIVTSRSGGAKGVILDAATGDSVGVLDMTGISGGTFPIQRIAATSDGQLFGANVVSNNDSNFKVYRWADESSAPTVIFEGALTETGRVGDAFGVVGSGNEVTIFAGGSAPTIVTFAWDGTTASKTEYAVPDGIARGGFSSAVSDSTVWVTGTGTSPRLFDFKNGAVIDTLVSADTDVLADADLNSVMTNDYYNGVVFAGPAFTNGKFYAIDAMTGELYAEVGPLGENANGNNTGGVAIDGENGMVYLMDSNNSITAFDLADFFETPADLFISEYIEGSSNNKALEIYNPTDEAVSLANYQIAQSVNGGGWEYFHKFKEDAVIEAGGTYVLITDEVDTTLFNHSNADEVLAYPSVVHFNGDDARAIIHITPADTTILDVFGKPDQDPGNGWDVAGVTEATQNKTLIRKLGFTGNPVELASFGTNAEDSEWIVKDQNDFSNLGSHDFFPKYMVTFQADMTAWIDSANFVPGTHNVWVRGGFNGWGTVDTLKDADGDGIYSITKELEVGSYDYKFFLTSRQYPAGEWESDPNNTVVVQDVDVTLNPVQPRISFRDFSNVNFDKVAVYFNVNMQVQLLTGAFNPDNGDKVQVRGSFDGWGAGQDLSETQDPNIYEGFIYLDDFALGGEVQYKFVTVVGDATNWEGGDNKVIVIEDRTYTAEERDENGYILAIAFDPENIPYFNNITPDKIFTENAEVLFEVDLRPAYYMVADSGRLPSDVQSGATTTSVDGLWANGPLVNRTNGWEEWGNLNQRDDLKLFDDGTNGDKVAGDSLFSRLFTFEPGDVREGEALKFGVNGQDNDAGFGVDRFPRLTDGETIRFIIGAIKRPNGEPYTALYNEYIGYDATNDRFFVRRRPDGEEIPSNIEELGNVPMQFALNQNYPNPFNPTTTIKFDIAKTANVTLTVYNILGQKVATLISNQMMSAGSYNYNFDASRLASGMYIYHLQAGSFSATKSMTLIK